MRQELYKKLIISNIIQETPEVKIFYFEEPVKSVISFKAGQYLTFIFDEKEHEVRRSYSIAASPILEEPISIGIKRIINGVYSRKLFDNVKVGESLVTLGAGGVFTLPEKIEPFKQIFFFAAGSGIIPIYSLIKTVIYTYHQIEIILIYSNSSIQKTVFYKDLNLLRDKFSKNLKIEFLFSNSGNLFKAHLHGNLIERFLQVYSKDSFDKALYYLCGPEAYMRLCIFTLHGLYVPSHRIKKEIFHTTKPTVKFEPPDINSHKVSLTINNDTYSLDVQYPMTILQAAKMRGIVLPYSCEVGKCGNCMAVCLKGKIWMSYNEVLTENELEKGLVLTCTGFPVFGNVELTFDIMDEPV